MDRVPIDDVEPEPDPVGVNDERRPVSEELGADAVDVTHYALNPGEAFSPELYTYRHHEELVYVTRGTATFEHQPRDPEAERQRTDVDAGELARFAPGEFRRGRNDGATELLGVTITAPLAEAGAAPTMEALSPCRFCEELTVHEVDDGGAYELTCTDCGTEMRLG